MSKQKFKSLRKYEYDDEYEVDTRGKSDKRKERRFDRALRVRSVEDLTNIDDDGLDPLDVEDEIWLDESVSTIDWKKK
jgi:hypothetical protein